MLSGTWSLKLPGRRLFPLLCRKQLAGSAAGDVPYLCKHIGVCAVTARDHTCTGLWERYLLFPRWEVYPIDTNLAWLYVQKDPQLNKVELSSLYVNNWYTHTHTQSLFAFQDRLHFPPMNSIPSISGSILSHPPSSVWTQQWFPWSYYYPCSTANILTHESLGTVKVCPWDKLLSTERWNRHFKGHSPLTFAWRLPV